ncbi:MAG: metallophosphoesterase, partial [Psychrobacter sp.]
MRYAFIITIIVLLQLFSLGAVLSLQWWLQPWIVSITIPLSPAMVWVVVFAITNSLLLLSVSKIFSNSYRWISAWMLVMHFIMLTALSTSLLYGSYWLLNSWFGITLIDGEILTIGLRIFALVFFVALFVYA